MLTAGLFPNLGGVPPRPAVVALAIFFTLATGILVTLVIGGSRKRMVVTPMTAHRDSQDALALVGNALASTHDLDGLLPAILNIAVEGTGAAGGRIRIGDEDAALVGSTRSSAPLVLPLSDDPMRAELILYPGPSGFEPEAEAVASSLAAQASIALENERLHRLVEEQATTDELTELPNRRLFTQSLTAEVARAKRGGARFSLVYADIDNFKRVNDSYGHPTGDLVLREFARVLRNAIREGDVAARLGGEEFACLLSGTDLEGARVLAERLRADLAARAIEAPDGRVVSVTVSVGISTYRRSQTAESMLRAADRALYKAKAGGKNRVAVSAGHG